MPNTTDPKKKPNRDQAEQEAPVQTPQVQPQATQPPQPAAGSNEAQMARRQSAPRPTIAGEAQKVYQMQQQRMMQGQGMMPTGAVNGFRVLERPIGREAVQKAMLTLNKYKEGKANLEKRIIDNEQWYKLRHWECMRDKTEAVQPTSAWLFNCIANKHADAMDNFPSPNILPREEGDKAEAEMLTSIVPVVLEQCDFEATYSDVQN